METKAKSLEEVVDRLVERRCEWLKEEGLAEGMALVYAPDGVLRMLKQFQYRHISSDTEAKLKQVWEKSDQEAADEIVALVQQGLDVKSDEGATNALHCASRNGNIDLVSLLLERGADIAGQDSLGQTALSFAVANGHIDVVTLLLDRGADMAAEDMLGRTTPHWAAFNGHRDVISLLLERGANVAAQDNDGRTALHWAASNGHIGVLSVLLDRGADIAARDNDDRTALHYASAYGHKNFVSLLLESGADAAAQDSDGETALRFAVENGKLDVISLLLDRGADINARNNHGNTSLQGAAAYGYTEVVKLLLEPRAINNDAATNDHTDARRGADVHAKDLAGDTALHDAATGGHKDVVLLLLDGNADIEAVNNEGDTALHDAAANGHKDVVLLLLDRDAGISAMNNDGLTILHRAVKRGSTAVVSLLLERGANADSVAKDGQNPLSYMILTKDDDPDDEYLAVALLLCSQEQKVKLPSSVQSPPLPKHQLGMIACARYWQERYEQNQPLLKVPLEVVKGGEDAVKAYLSELEKSATDEVVHRRKICVVGPSTWGKSSLIKSMTQEARILVDADDRTTGIDLLSLEFTEEGDEKKKHHVTFWDFAGQDVYHVAHTVFFSKRTLYLVCVDIQVYAGMLEQAKEQSKMKREEFKHRFFEDNVLRWMVLVLFRQPDAQFKLIGTKHDVVSASARTEVVNDVKLRLIKFLEDPDGNMKITGGVAKELRQEFVKDMATANLKNVESIKQVKSSIQDAISAKPQLSFLMPATYTQVLNYIMKLRTCAAKEPQEKRLDSLIMSVDELTSELMRMPGLKDTNCREILRVLHQLGDVLWYEDCGENFKDWIILEPSLMLDLVREVVNHKYEDAIGEDYKELWSNGTLPHSLLLTFKLWKCLADIDMTMVQKFKHLLHHLNLVYPVNDLDKLDEADIIVPMYWKMRGNTSTAHKPLTRQETILGQNVRDDWYAAKWRYSLPIAISDVLFVNFVVKCFRPYVHSVARDTRFSICVRGEFHAAIELSTNTTGRLDDITIEVAAPTKKFAWAEMRYYVIAMEQVLEKDYPGLSEHAKLKRSIVDDQGKDHDVNNLMGKVEGEARLRDTKAPWLPPDFTWFIQRAWRNPEVLDTLHLRHRLEVLKNLVITSQSNSLPSLWTLMYPEKGSPVELRIHSDFSGGCFHEPLKINVTDNLFTKYPKFFQTGITALSIASAAIPFGVAGAAAEKVLEVSRSRLDKAITVKSILDKAKLGPGEEKPSQELGSPEKRAAFLLELLVQHDPPLDRYTIGAASGLHRAASNDDDCYIWVSQDEVEQLGLTRCNPELDIPVKSTPSPVVVNPPPLSTVSSITFGIIDATGTWPGKCFTKMYCTWELLHNSEIIAEGATKKTPCTRSDTTWGSEVVNLTKAVGSIEKFCACTLRVWVKRSRRLPWFKRSDKVIAQGEQQLHDQVAADCSANKLIDVAVKVLRTTSQSHIVNCQISIEFSTTDASTSCA